MPGLQARTRYAETLPECVGKRGGRRVRDGRQRFPPPVFFFCPAKRCGKRTADAGRNDDAMRLGPAWASKERFSLPQRRILHGGRPYMAWNGHGVQPASSVLTFNGRSARLLSIYPIYSLKIFKAYGSSLYRRKGLAGLRRKIGNAGRTGPAAGTPVRAEDGQQLNRLAGRMSCAGSQQADAAILPGAGTDSVLQRRRKVFLPGKRRRGIPRIENRT